jgi:uncharacterized RDD family membrane protein YckC
MTDALYGRRTALDRAWTGDPPDPLSRPEYYDSVVLRRSAAFLIDCVIVTLLMLVLYVAVFIFGILTLSLGFILFPLLALAPLAYWTFLMGGPSSATLGMRLMDLELRSWGGDRANLLQGLVMAAGLYATWMFTSGLLLLAVFFNPRRRAVHDYLAGAIVVRRLPALAVTVSQA